MPSAVAHGLVGRVGRAGQRRGDQDRVDQLAGPRGQFLRRAADDLGQDHARAAARAEQRRAGHHRDQLVAPDLVDHLAVDRVELVQHGAHGHRHVVAGVAVGDREDVEVVDLLATALQLGVSRRHRPLETDQPIGHCHIDTRARSESVTSGVPSDGAPRPADGGSAAVRTVYLGTSDFAVRVLRRLADSPHRPQLVVTRPDRPRGAGASCSRRRSPTRRG